MEIPNYDFNEDEYTNFKQLYPYMPKSTFRMLICGNSGSGKTNLVYHILMKPLVYYDQIHLYGKNLEQEKYRNMIKELDDFSDEVGYDIISYIYSNDEITPVTKRIDPDSQTIVISHDFVREKNFKKNLLIISCEGEIRIVRFFLSQSQSLFNTKRYQIKLCTLYII